MRLIYFDTETTGVDAKNDRVIELAGFDALNKKSFVRLIHPGRPIPKEATAIHGITDEMVASEPNFGVVFEEFVTFCGKDAVLVAHNGESFDLPFLAEETKRHQLKLPSWPMIDSLKWARKYRPDLPRHSLQFLRQVYGVAENNAHRALDDVLVLHEVFSIMIDDLSVETVLELIGGKPQNLDVMPFGKHKGIPLKELPKDYVAWLKKQELNSDLKLALEKHA